VPTRFHNAIVWTGLGQPLQNALTVQDGIVVSNALPASDSIDCQGATILPAFIDGHGHPSFAAKHLLGPDVTNCASIAEVRDTVRSWIEQLNAHDWVVGGSYDRSMADAGAFEAVWLDDEGISNPVVLHASDHHSIWVNSKALKRAGLNASPGGHGTFFEDTEKSLILDHVPKPTNDALGEAIRSSLQTMLENGIVATIDAWIDEDTRDSYEGVESPVEVSLGHWITADNWRAANFENQDVKFFVDGVLGSATACVSEGYLDGVASTAPVWNSSELFEAMRKFNSHGCRLHLHAIGDGAVDIALELIQRLDCKQPPVLVHAELLRDDQIETLANLDIWVCSQPLWARVDSLSIGALKRLSASQQAQLYRNKDLIDAGGKLAFGSDWPVSDLNPLLGIYTAVHRQVSGQVDSVLNLEQSVSLEQAIHAYTASPASMLGLSRSGYLKPGSRADFVLLNKNPFADNGVSLPHTKVMAVYLSGAKVFDAK
jgi:predicted amidohydrolase YtcJ